MMKKQIFWIIISHLILSYVNLFADNPTADVLFEECTLGVASGRATADKRPLLWKTRDYDSERNNEVKYNTSYKYKFIAVVNAGESTPWMGINEKGLAILNSTSSDLPGGSSGPGNGEIMRNALANCATMAEFEQLLNSTNISGRTTQTNIGVIDSTGAAAIFEIGGNVYWKFDANDPAVAPDGYVLRTNFAFNGDAKNGIYDGLYSVERYRRQVKLIGDFYAGDSLSYHSIMRKQMRDFSDAYSNPVPVPYPKKWASNRPYGYIYCYLSICRSTSVSAAVIQGVLPGESAKLSTMWTMLGQPASAIAVPYWPVGKTPSEADGPSTAPLCDVANQIRALLFDYTENSSYIDSYKLRDDDGNGLWAQTFSAEDSIFTAAEEKLDQWRANGFSSETMLTTESELAKYALSVLRKAYNQLITSVPAVIAGNNPQTFLLEQNYPNPFNSFTSIPFRLTEPGHVRLTIFNLLGEEVVNITTQEFSAGEHTTHWNASGIASGVYLYQLRFRSNNGDIIATKTLQLVK